MDKILAHLYSLVQDQSLFSFSSPQFHTVFLVPKSAISRREINIRFSLPSSTVPETSDCATKSALNFEKNRKNNTEKKKLKNRIPEHYNIKVKWFVFNSGRADHGNHFQFKLQKKRIYI